jgi:hypothetical protein
MTARRPPPPPPPKSPIPKLPPPPVPLSLRKEVPRPGAQRSDPQRPDPSRAVPPPLPRAPVPSLSPSTKEKVSLSMDAHKLRDEQVRAEVRYYGADLETNAELDHITAAVVAELRKLKMVKTGDATRSADVEIELIHNLRSLLERLFAPDRPAFLKQLIVEAQRRITQLFFHSELYAELAERSGETIPAASWHEQALYFVLKRHEAELLAELDQVPVVDETVRERARERLTGYIRQLASDFLSRTTPELQALLAIYRDVLTRYFTQTFPESLGELSWEVIRESQVARGHPLGYKITADRFERFRTTFDKKLIERLAFEIQEPVVSAASQGSLQFRDVTLRFVADPHVFSEICAAVADAIYHFLYNEGYLDLPAGFERRVQERRR